jgi:hypothetical protein
MDLLSEPRRRVGGAAIQGAAGRFRVVVGQFIDEGGSTNLPRQVDRRVYG